MVRILAIGNSFSEDALAYLHDMALADGRQIETVNLYIPGCSLKTHCQAFIQRDIRHTCQVNGAEEGREVFIRDVLKESWDYITVQQASHDSGKEETYAPYLEELLSHIRSLNPGVPIYLHQTWAYEIDSDHEGFYAYGRSQNQMFEALRDAYDKAARKFSLPVIPSGEIIQRLRKQPFFAYERGGRSLCRDGYHMELLYGRYALSLTWYRFLLGGKAMENEFVPGEKAQAEPERLAVIKNVVEEAWEELKAERESLKRAGK